MDYVQTHIGYIQTNADLSANLKAVRIKCGLSQEQVAKQLNICRSTYAYYETGKTIPSIFQITHLTKIFSVPLMDLIGCHTRSV